MARRRSSIPGVSFSAKRALGVTSAKRKVARATGIPTTRSGRRAKAGRMMGCATMILIVFLIVAALMLGVSALAEEPAATTDPGLASLREKLDKWSADVYAKYGAEQDAVNGFFDEIGETLIGTAPWSNPSVDVCAQYALMPAGYLCKTGVDSDEALLYNIGDYQYDESGNLLSKSAKTYTPDEIWATYDKLVEYIKNNSDAIYAAGCLHEGYYAYVLIDIFPTNDTQYRAIYEILGDTLTLNPVE